MLNESWINWIDEKSPDKLLAEDSIRGREGRVNELVLKTADDISLQVSLMTVDEHKEFIKETLGKLNISLKGVGAELGAGAAVFSNSIASIFPNVQRIYAIEIVLGMVTNLQPKITKYCGNEKVIKSVYGSFDNIKLPNSSLDFVIEFDSLHHSNDMEKTIVEAMRVLKKGGILICYDRAHPNSLTNEQKKYLLNIDYSKEFKKNHKLNPDIPFTREQNGEHEPRLEEWINSFNRAGSTLTNVTIFTKKNWRSFRMSLIAQIPFFLRRKLGKGANLSNYFKLFMYHFFPLVGIFGQLKIQTFDTILSSSNAPLGKMVLIAKKN